MVFGLAYFFVGATFLASLVVAGAAYVLMAVWAVIHDRRRAERARSNASGADPDSARRAREQGASGPTLDLGGLGITEQQFYSELSAGTQKLTTLKRTADTVSNQSVRGKAFAVCDAVARILSDIREDPKDLRPARKFLGYYLDATINVVDRYATLSAKNVPSSELAASLRRAEDSLDTIKRAYDKQLAQLLENDVMDLDTEIEVLERTIKSEGLAD